MFLFGSRVSNFPVLCRKLGFVVNVGHSQLEYAKEEFVIVRKARAFIEWKSRYNRSVQQPKGLFHWGLHKTIFCLIQLSFPSFPWTRLRALHFHGTRNNGA